MKTSVLCLVAVVSVAAAAQIVSREVPTEGEPHMLQCPAQGDLQYFLLNSRGAAIMTTETYSETEEIQAFVNGTIIFKSVKVEYEGIHLCMMQGQNNKLTAHQVPLKVRPLPPQDLWAAVYESMFVTGLISALVIALVFALGCLVYKKQWRPKSEDALPVIGYENPVMNNYEDGDSGNTKM